jgi:hypothetical protein
LQKRIESMIQCGNRTSTALWISSILW